MNRFHWDTPTQMAFTLEIPQPGPDGRMRRWYKLVLDPDFAKTITDASGKRQPGFPSASELAARDNPLPEQYAIPLNAAFIANIHGLQRLLLTECLAAFYGALEVHGGEAWFGAPAIFTTTSPLDTSLKGRLAIYFETQQMEIFRGLASPIFEMIGKYSFEVIARDTLGSDVELEEVPMAEWVDGVWMMLWLGECMPWMIQGGKRGGHLVERETGELLVEKGKRRFADEAYAMLEVWQGEGDWGVYMHI